VLAEPERIRPFGLRPAAPHLPADIDEDPFRLCPGD
jgi:hypothetical protein